MQIQHIDAYTVFDSRGLPTIEAVVQLENGLSGSAIVPSGASTGKYEALELRDGDAQRFGGKSVFRAIAHIRGEIASCLCGQDVRQQAALDQLMIDLDGTPNKSRLGANAILAVSMACARAAAQAAGLPLFAYLSGGKGDLLPIPEIQIIGGGAHSAGRIDIQDFMIVCPGARSLFDCFEMTANVYRETGKILASAGKLAGVADEGGYWPVFDTNEAVFETVIQAIEQAGYEPGREVAISLDIAASELFEKGEYHLNLEGKTFSSSGFYEYLSEWCNRYPICSMEDPFAEDDHESWARFTKEFGDRLQIIGDDLFVTNPDRIRRGIAQGLANSVLIKPNQIGTLTETLECARLTQAAGWQPVVSARSGETEDAFVSHLAVATHAGQLKVGSFTRSERMVKWNELLRIERTLGDKARFAGAK